jgi:hypothetical protein
MLSGFSICGVTVSPKIIDHTLETTRINGHRIKVAAPIELTAERSNPGRTSQAEKSPQSLLHSRALSFESRRAQNITHELVIDYDIRGHGCVCV